MLPVGLGSRQAAAQPGPSGRVGARRYSGAVEAVLLYILGVLVVVVGLVVSIALHELGHFVPAKRFGVRVGQFMIGFGRVEGDCNLSPRADLAEAAARLYACLHAAAAAPQPRVAVARIPDEGIGAAINDRLRRAAA